VALTGHPVVVTGDSISSEKLEALNGYGARVCLRTGARRGIHRRTCGRSRPGPRAQIPRAWRPLQFDNPANPWAHYEGTAPEIWEQTAGRVTHFVAGVGTGGTISGNGRYLKEKSGGHVEVIGADPYGSVYSGGHPGQILVDGVGNSWPRPDWPKVFDRGLLDRFLRIPNDEVYTTLHRLLNDEGLSLGPSSGLTVAAALRVAKAGPHGSVVVWLADNHIRLAADLAED
jgi:cystathionine beta-synthase/cysteine synthase A